MRRRASALIIKDKKLLLVSDNGTWYWTPGGRPEEGESYEDAIHREVREELNVGVVGLEHILTYQFEPDNTANFISESGEEACFLVEIDTAPVVGAEIRIMKWLNVDEIMNMSLLQSMKDNVISLLIKKGLL